MAKPIPEMPSSVFVALVGRPNVGKSSLTNHLVGEKVAIVGWVHPCCTVGQPGLIFLRFYFLFGF